MSTNGQEEPLSFRGGVGAGPPVPETELSDYTRKVEAVLFAAVEPLAPADIRAYAGEGDLGAALETLVADYAVRGVNLVQRGGRWLFQTAPDCASVLERARDVPRKLGRAALETLAIIAYHEPVTRPDVEEIRGVATSRGTLDTLMEAGFVAPAGRRESPGRPMQYATTPAFLAHFALETRRDLPGIAELKSAGLLDPLPESIAPDLQPIGTDDGDPDDADPVEPAEDGLSALAPSPPSD